MAIGTNWKEIPMTYSAYPRRRFAGLMLLLLGFALIALIGPSPASAGHPIGGKPKHPPCSSQACDQRLWANSDWQTWESRQRFSSRAGVTELGVVLTIRGHRLAGAFAGKQACRGVFSRYKVIAWVDICGDPTRVRVSFRSLGNPKPLRVEYRSYTY